MNDRQIRLFRELRILIAACRHRWQIRPGCSWAAAVHCDLVRPGVALFGANPTPGRPNPMRPVVELKGRILQVREVKRGDTVGYGATFTAQRATRLAIVAVGYADGLLRSAAEDRQAAAPVVLVAGKRCPIVGRVSMDLIAVDVTDLADGRARRGDFVTLIGNDCPSTNWPLHARHHQLRGAPRLGHRYTGPTEGRGA